MIRLVAQRQPTLLGKCLRKLFRVSFSNVGMLIIVFVYLVLGGFLFKFLENHKKADGRIYFQKYRDQCIQELWSITKSSYVLYKQNWTLDALDPIKKFEAIVVKEIITNHQLLAQTWSYMDSFFYSVTILTTIGYNDHTPKTSFGKIATIIYAAFGIPLMLLCVCNIGLMLSDLLQFGPFNKHLINYRKENNDCKFCEHGKYDRPMMVKRNTIVSVNDETSSNRRSTSVRHMVLEENQMIYSKEEHSTLYDNMRLRDSCALCQQSTDFDINCDWCKQNMRYNSRDTKFDGQNHQNEDKMESRIFWFPITFTISLIIVHVCVGALTYAAWKKKSFADGAYFSFLTLTTIGSCDIFRNLFNVTSETIALMLYCVYLLTGLVLTASLIVLIQKSLQTKSNLSLNMSKKIDEVAL